MCEEIVNGAFSKIEKQIPSSALEEHLPGWYLQYSTFYFYLVEVVAVALYRQRQEVIHNWMDRDGQKDQRLAGAQLATMPYCRSCGGTMGNFNKFYMHRQDTERNVDDDILFMFECKSCKQRLVCWQDGTEWEGPEIKCSKCSAMMIVEHQEPKTHLSSTYTCSSCSHTYQETIDFGKRMMEEPEADAIFELDRKRFCINDDTVQKIDDKFAYMGRLGQIYADAGDRTEHADVFDAIKEIKQLKIAQLIDLLRKATEGARYSEFKSGEPQLG
jgi:predicted RNA-binding Zn-ribbon protein involved in translation (DUF1610 family)